MRLPTLKIHFYFNDQNYLKSQLNLSTYLKTFTTITSRNRNRPSCISPSSLCAVFCQIFSHPHPYMRDHVFFPLHYPCTPVPGAGAIPSWTIWTLSKDSFVGFRLHQSASIDELKGTSFYIAGSAFQSGIIYVRRPGRQRTDRWRWRTSTVVKRIWIRDNLVSCGSGVCGRVVVGSFVFTHPKVNWYPHFLWYMFRPLHIVRHKSVLNWYFLAMYCCELRIRTVQRTSLILETFSVLPDQMILLSYRADVSHQ